MAWIKVARADYEANPKKYDAQVTREHSLKVVNEDGSAGKQVHWVDLQRVPETTKVAGK